MTKDMHKQLIHPGETSKTLAVDVYNTLRELHLMGPSLTAGQPNKTRWSSLIEVMRT